MRKILSVIALLLATVAAQATEVQTSVNLPLEGAVVATKVVLNTDDYTATIGWGYDACIPQYSVGKLDIPSTVTYNNEDYTVTAIANVAFRFCTQLTEVEIEEGVTTIGNYAFIGCSNLEAISLPASLTTIGGGAFCGLSKLDAIKACATAPPTWSWYDVLQVNGGTDEVNSNLKLYVPDGSQNNYLAAKWDYSWTCMNTGTNTWGLTETRSQVGWGSYFDASTIRTLEEWNQHRSINIFTVADLVAFRDMVNGGTTYKNYIITLEADLDLNNEEWTPIGRVVQSASNMYYDFCGTFDGKGHTIKNFKISGSSHNMGLFGGTRDATIEKLIVEDASVEGNFYVGTVVGHAEGKTFINDVYVKNCTVSGKCFTGGIIGGAVNYDHGDNCDLQMDRCVIAGGSVCSKYNEYKIEIENNDPFWNQYPYYGTVGGLVGYVDRANVQNCANLNTKVFWDSSSATTNVEDLIRTVTRGALIGYQQYDATNTPAMSKCYVLLHPENSLTPTNYDVTGHSSYLDPDRYYGNAYSSGGVNHWSYNLNTLAKSGDASDLNGLQLQSKLGYDGWSSWAYTDGQLPLPGYFAYMFGDIAANKVVYLPSGIEVGKPNYLSYGGYQGHFSTHSITFDDNFVSGNGYLPLGTEIIMTYGINYDRTLNATVNGIEEVTYYYPVYQRDENNMPVLDNGGNPVQATNDDGSPMTQPVTENVTRYETKGYTLCLPYSLTLEGNCRLYQPSAWDADTQTMTFSRVTDNVVEPFKPYYVVVTEGEIGLGTSTETEIQYGDPSLSPHPVTVGDFSFTGTLAAIPNDALYDASNPAYVLNGDQWTKVTDGGDQVNAFSAYFTTTGSNEVASMSIRLEDCLDVAGYGNGNDKWVFIASPVIGSVSPTAVTGLLGHQIADSPVTYDYDLYRFNQSAELEWQNYHQRTNDFVLRNGEGYLFACKDDVELVFEGTMNTESTKSVVLDYEPNCTFSGWNLVGNPFLVPAWASKSYYTMNSEGTGLVANEVASSTPIPPLTGVMIQATAENQTVTFSTTEPTQQSANNNGGLQIALSQAVEPVETPSAKVGPSTSSETLVLDNAIVTFNEGEQLGKFYFGNQNANIYLPQDGKEYAIVSVGRDAARHVSTEVNEIPVHFKAKVDGEYTISVNPEGVEMEYLHLIDNLTGADVDLLGDAKHGDAKHCVSTYTFTAKTSDYASRFRLVFAAGDVAGGDACEPGFAYISNGEIVLTDADAFDASLQVVDVMGRVVLCRDAALHVSTSGMTPGVYVLRLINGKDVRTQKIVIP